MYRANQSVVVSANIEDVKSSLKPFRYTSINGVYRNFDILGRLPFGAFYNGLPG
jgi:hypothetical protein